MKIVLCPISKLKPYKDNPRINEQAVAAVAASIKEYGFRNPIIVDSDYVIIAGHTRYKAALKVKLAKVPIHIATDLTPAQVRAYRIADNKTAELAEWEPDLLAGELVALQEMDVDLEALGFTEYELDELISGGPVEGLTDPDDVPKPPAEPVTKPGDLLLLGEHRVLCGDATKAEDVARMMRNKQCALIVTSPPYNQDIENFSKSGMHTETKWIDQTRAGAYPDNLPEDEYQEKQAAAILIWASFLTPTASIFYNHKNRFRNKQCISPWHWLDKTGAKVRQEIIWMREGSVTQNMRGFMPVDERIFWLYFGDDFYFDDSTEHKTWSTIWRINSYKDRGNSAHGCAFPIELPSRVIRACSNLKDIVSDPYLGSGTTLIAAEQLNRRCYGLEIEPRYCDVIVQRWENFTGRKAKRE